MAVIYDKGRPVQGQFGGFVGAERGGHETDFCADLLITGFTMELTLQVVVADTHVCGVRRLGPTRGILTFNL